MGVLLHCRGAVRVFYSPSQQDYVVQLKESMEHEGDSDTNCNGCTWNNLQGLSKRAGGVGNQRMSEDHPNYSIIEVGQNTE